MALITHRNGFRAMVALRAAARDPRLDEIEGNGMDDGRVFLHAKPGWIFRRAGTHSKSVGTVKELRAALKDLVAEGA